MKRKDFKIINYTNFINFKIIPKDSKNKVYKIDYEKIIFMDDNNNKIILKKNNYPLIWNYYYYYLK
jgi:hypothetical protein